MGIALDQIQASLGNIGYSKSMLSRNVSFIQEGGGRYQTDMVAYSNSLRKDVDTAVIAIKATQDVSRIIYRNITPFFAIATPIVIFVEPIEDSSRGEPNFRTLGLCKDEESFVRQFKKSKAIPSSKFSQYLIEKKGLFTPRRLEAAKRSHEQLSLFDLFPNLLEKATEIASKELIDKFERAVDSIITNMPKVEQKSNIIDSAIKLLSARILRDRINQNWSLTDINSFLTDAENFLPSYFHIREGLKELIEPLLRSFHVGYDLSQVSLDMVGQLYEKLYVDKGTRERSGIHYTKSRLAKSILDRIPIEELPPDKRILWDPTCGSGNLLAAGYERLASAEFLQLSADARHQKLVKMIYGNDKDGIAAMIARMTLMLFHPPHKNNWNISQFDAETRTFERQVVGQIGHRPNIIVANPPFGGTGNSNHSINVRRRQGQRDRSAFILNQCLDILSDNGLLGIILTATVLDQQQERDIRSRILKQCQIIEQWSVPSYWFDDVQRPALVLILRKTPPVSTKFYLYYLSNVPVDGGNCRVSDLMSVDIKSIETRLVPTIYPSLIKKIEKPKSYIKDYYFVHNGFRKPRFLLNKKNTDAYPYTGNAVGTTPYTDLRHERHDCINLSNDPNSPDENFDGKSQRTGLRKQLLRKSPCVLLRANRTDPQREKWSSIALLDVPEGLEKPIVPYECFHALFPKSDEKVEQKFYSYALWAVLNHPLASFYFYETKIVPWINTRQLREFPLPDTWNIEGIKDLAKTSAHLINILRFALAPDLSDVLRAVRDIDKVIYEMYEMTKPEIQQIEEMLGDHSRPLLKGLKNLNDTVKIKKREPQTRSENIFIEYNEHLRTTTFEILEIKPQQKLIRIAIDGMVHPQGEVSLSDSGIWLKIIPVMPGWILKQGSVGWIELTTSNAMTLRESPERHIVGFKLFKNSFVADDEIDREFINDHAS